MSAYKGRYPTGSDYTVYITDLVPGDRVMPDFGEEEPLDISNIGIIEEGQVTPLYDIARRKPDHFVYSRRMVNGTLTFNYSQDFAERFRSSIQSIRDKTLWVRLSYVDFAPSRSVQDTYRISAAWEHTFQHQPDPVAQEQVPFTAREMVLIERSVAEFDSNLLQDIVMEEDTQEITTQSVFRRRQNRYPGRIVNVVDGDTYDVRLNGLNRTVRVRPTNVNTPETDAKDNDANDVQYRWPANANPDDVSLGSPGDSPSPAHLAAWSSYAKERAEDWLTDDQGEGIAVDLVTDQGNAIQGNFDRYTFRVVAKEHIEPDLSSITPTRDLSRLLIRHGYAVRYRSQSIDEIDGSYRNLGLMLEQEIENLRDRAGKEDTVEDGELVKGATGVWYSFDVQDWKDYVARDNE